MQIHNMKMKGKWNFLI